MGDPASNDANSPGPGLERPTSNASTAAQVAGTLANQLLLLILGVASSLLAARLLGATGRGVLAAAAVGPTLTVAILSLGIPLANIYFVSRRDVSPGLAAGTSFYLGIALGVVGVGGYLTVVLASGASNVQLPLSVLVLSSSLIPIQLLFRFSTSIVQGQGRIAIYNMALLIQAGLVVIAYGILLAGLSLGVWGGLIASAIATLGALGFVAFRLWDPSVAWAWDPQVAKTHIRFGLRGELGNLVQLLNYRIDIVFVSLLAGYGSVGVYVVAVAAAELLWQAPNAVSTVLLPKIASSQAREQTTARAIGLNLWALGFIAVLGALGAPLFFRVLYGSEFADAADAFRLLLPGVVAISLGKIAAAHISGSGHPGLPSLASAAGLLVTVVFDLSLIPHHGIRGAAVASSLAYMTTAFLLLVIFRMRTHVPLRSLVAVPFADIRSMVAALRLDLGRLRGRRA